MTRPHFYEKQSKTVGLPEAGGVRWRSSFSYRRWRSSRDLLTNTVFVVNHTILCTEHFKRIDVMLSVITIKKGSFRRTMNNKKKKKRKKSRLAWNLKCQPASHMYGECNSLKPVTRICVIRLPAWSKGLFILWDKFKKVQKALLYCS